MILAGSYLRLSGRSDPEEVLHMKKIVSLLLAIVLVLGLAACGKPADNTPANNSGDAAQTRIITDMYGREVEIPAKVEKIICTGSNALRMVTYLQGTDLLCGVESGDQAYEKSTKRDYAHVFYNEFKDLPVIGKGGGTAYTADPEAILKADPDIILTCYVQEAAEQLARETGIPVISIRTPSANFIDDNWIASLKLTADIIGRQDRCEELIKYINECKDDLKKRSDGVPDAEKPTVYTGAVTFSGAHGFAGTYANFGPFMAINAKNVADETDNKASFEVDLEKVAAWDPDIIFLDPGNMNLVNDEYAAKPDFFNSLSAVKNGKVYTMPSFNNYSTNITYCLMDAYFAGTILYPEQFKDIDMKTKGAEIMKAFLGKEWYDVMQADGLYYGTITLGQ